MLLYEELLVFVKLKKIFLICVASTKMRSKLSIPQLTVFYKPDSAVRDIAIDV